MLFKEKGLQITVLVLRVGRNSPVRLLHFNNKNWSKMLTDFADIYIYERYFLLSLIFLVNIRDRQVGGERFKIHTVYIFHQLPLRAVVRRNRRKGMFSGCASLVLSRLLRVGGCSLSLTLLTHICFLFSTLFFPSVITLYLSVFVFVFLNSLYFRLQNVALMERFN